MLVGKHWDYELLKPPAVGKGGADQNTFSTVSVIPKHFTPK